MVRKVVSCNARSAESAKAPVTGTFSWDYDFRENTISTPALPDRGSLMTACLRQHSSRPRRAFNPVGKAWEIRAVAEIWWPLPWDDLARWQEIDFLRPSPPPSPPLLPSDGKGPFKVLSELCGFILLLEKHISLPFFIYIFPPTFGHLLANVSRCARACVCFKGLPGPQETSFRSVRRHHVANAV